MGYNLQRPAERSGTGNLKVFRAIALGNQPLRQTPQGWVESQPSYHELATNPDPARAAGLFAGGDQTVPKVWTEIAYEKVRLDIAPELPSRLSSLYAFADPLEAFSLEQVTAVGAKDVWEGEIDPNAPWALVDMAQFNVPLPTNWDVDGFREAWTIALNQAANYWNPGQRIETAEVLVAGAVNLKHRLTILDLFRTMGLVADQDDS